MLSSRKIATKWYPFGMLAQRYNAKSYRFGFNGKENDNEVIGKGRWQDYGARMYRPDLARFFSPDPLIVYEKKYPWYSSYQFAGNKPIIAIDLDGLEEFDYKEHTLNDGSVLVAITLLSDKGLEEGFKIIHTASGVRYDFKYTKINDIMKKTKYGKSDITNEFMMLLPQQGNVYRGKNIFIDSKGGWQVHFILGKSEQELYTPPRKFSSGSNDSGGGIQTRIFNIETTTGKVIFHYANVSIEDSYKITDSEGNLIYETGPLQGEGTFEFSLDNMASPLLYITVTSDDPYDSNWSFSFEVIPKQRTKTTENEE